MAAFAAAATPRGNGYACAGMSRDWRWHSSQQTFSVHHGMRAACSFVHIIDVAKVILPSYSQVVVTPSPIFLPMEMLLCAISSSRNDLQVLFAIAAATH